jgi:saccharopine dehydrogenase-like NADP-dependent oxidoreductase
MRRIIVAGGFGFFGRGVVELLREAGFSPLVGSRRGSADLVVDVEEGESIRRAFRAGDVIVDAVGPFQRRSTRLVEAAVDRQFHVVDLADSFDYVSAVYERRQAIDDAGICYVTACSGMSSISAAAIVWSQIREPVRLTGFLVPATRHTAVPGTAESLFYSVGRPIRVLEDGTIRSRPGWLTSRTFAMPAPVGVRRGYLFESADLCTLPLVWPSLQRVEFYVDTNVLGLNALFGVVARCPRLRGIIDRLRRPGVRAARWLGRTSGGLGYEIEGPGGEVARLSATATHRGYVTALAPAVLVARRLATDSFSERGLVPPHRHVDPDEFMDYVRRHGVTVHASRTVQTGNHIRTGDPSATTTDNG